jgi:hypothetical protein
LWRLLPSWLVQIPISERLLTRSRNLILYWLWHLITGYPYFIVAVFDGKRLANYSVARGRDLRVPAMEERDLCVGSWTHPAKRRRGIAAAALSFLTSTKLARDRRIWWICLEENMASNLIAKNQGFLLAKHCERKARFGLQALGYYSIEMLTHRPARSVMGCVLKDRT